MASVPSPVNDVGKRTSTANKTSSESLPQPPHSQRQAQKNSPWISNPTILGIVVQTPVSFTNEVEWMDGVKTLVRCQRETSEDSPEPRPYAPLYIAAPSMILRARKRGKGSWERAVSRSVAPVSSTGPVRACDHPANGDLYLALRRVG